MKTIECVSRDTLKQYLAGWMDEPQTAEIEEHLEACETCEQTVIELEGKPDTIFDPLRQLGPSTAGAVEADALLQDAVKNAEQLVKPAVRSVEIEAQPAISTVGPYELIRKLGHGGMGAVYLAKHKTLNKHVAIKMLPASWAANEEAVARFRREIMAAGKLNHASIVSATDAGEQNGMHYLVMEYVEGIDLSQIARMTGPLNIVDACEMMRQVASGLSYAHAGGIVHRDVKPSNVMLDNRGQVKVLDFGLAQLNPWDEAAAELTSVGQLMGTLDYMAPEQAERPSAVDYRADLYALGATLFRLLAGRAPLAAAPNLSPLHKLRLLAEHTPPRLDTLRRDTPPELVKLVASLLARRPEARPASAAHVAEQLAPLCAGADLVALATRARAAVDQAVDPAGLSNRFVRPEAGSSEAARRQNANRGGRWLRWSALTGLAALALFAGVLIVLETRKGQLVIESDVPGVHVKLLSGGKVTEELQLETGTTSTRLAADKYEIVLDSPSDSIMVDKSEFVLKRGGTIIARIRQREAAPAIAESMKLSLDKSDSKEPIYDGKRLSDWIEQLSRERSPKAIGEALTAIEALVQKDTADRITQSLVGLLPSMDGNTDFVTGVNTASTVDHAAFAILAKANPSKAYFELLAKLLVNADAAWGKRVLHAAFQKTLASSDEEMEPLFRWMETSAFANTEGVAANRELVETSASTILALLFAGAEAKHDIKAIERRFLPLLEKSRHVSSAVWLSVAPQPKWSNGSRRAVTQHALGALKDPAENPRMVAQAAMILREALGNATAKSELEASEVADAVRDRLSAIADDRPRMWQLTEVEYSFRRLALPRVPSGIQLTDKGSQASEIMKLLDLVAVLKRQGETRFELAPIVKATSEAYLKVTPLIPPSTPRRGGGPMVQLTWPSLDSYQIMGAPRPGQVPLTPSDWLGFLMCAQAAELGEIPLPTLDSGAAPPENGTLPPNPNK